MSTANRVFVEISPHSLQLAVMTGRRLVACGDYSLDDKEALAAFIATHQVKSVDVALVSPRQPFARLAGEEAGSVRSEEGLLACAQAMSAGPMSAAACDAATGKPVDPAGREQWLLAGTTAEGLKSAREQLAALGLPVPAVTALALPAQLGSVVAALQDMPESTRVAVLALGESDSVLGLVSAAGIEAVRPVALGYSQIYDAVQAELGLKFRAAAPKLFFNAAYDFGDKAEGIATRLAVAVQEALGGLAERPAILHVVALPEKQEWLGRALGKALGLAGWTPDAGKTCSQLEIEAPAGITPTANTLRLIQLAAANDATQAAWLPYCLGDRPKPAPAPVPTAPAATPAPAAAAAPVVPPAPSPAPKKPVVPPPAPAKAPVAGVKPATPSPGPIPKPVAKPTPAPVPAPKPVSAPKPAQAAAPAPAKPVAPVKPPVMAKPAVAAKPPAPKVVPPAPVVAAAPAAPVAPVVPVEPVAAAAAPVETPAPAAPMVAPVHGTPKRSWGIYGVIALVVLIGTGVSVKFYLDGRKQAKELAAREAIDNERKQAVARAEASLKVDPVTGLPGSWLAADIGAGTTAGSAAFKQAEFRLKGYGRDIGTTKDSYLYTYIPMTGDGLITVRVITLSGATRVAKVGLMMRATLDEASSHVSLLLENDGQSLKTVWREKAGDNTSVYDSTGGAVMNVPVWLRLVRAGNTITAYHSDNGRAWRMLRGPQLNVAMPEKIFVGLAVCSREDDVTQMTVDHVSVPGWESAPPILAGGE